MANARRRWTCTLLPDDLTGDDHAAGTLGAYLDPECSVPLPAWGDGPG
jgi:hypothetical protein